MFNSTPLRFVSALVLLTGLGFLQGCATKTSVENTWTAPDIGEFQFSKVFVVVLADNDFNRRLAESAVSELFKKVPAVFSTTVLPDPRDAKSKDKVLEAVKNNQADGIIVMRLGSTDMDVNYGPNMARPMDYQVETFSTYYGSVYDIGAYYSDDRRQVNAETYYGVETKIFDVKTEKLVWVGRTQSKRDISNDRDVRGLATEVGLAVRDTLQSQKLLR